MFKKDLHQHKYTKRGYKRDLPDEKSSYNGKPRWILFRICECGDKTATDFTTVNPKPGLT